MSTRKVTLRAFKITNNELTKLNSGLLQLMSDRLGETAVQDRRMLLNENDPSKEEDLISNFSPKSNGTALLASILRIRQGEETVSIPNDMFQEKSFLLSDLKTLADIAAVYKDIQYVYLNDDVAIVCWFGNKTIKSVQTYVNWLLEDARGDFVFQLTPMLNPVNAPQLKDLKHIKLQDSATLGNTNSQQGNAVTFKQRIHNLKEIALNSLFKDIKGLDERIIDEIVSAELHIKFNKKPKDMEQADYDKTFGAVMKPISDLEDVAFETKNGNKIKASEIALTKQVSVDITTNNQLSENSLSIEMELFMKEILKRDENN